MTIVRYPSPSKQGETMSKTSMIPPSGFDIENSCCYAFFYLMVVFNYGVLAGIGD